MNKVTAAQVEAIHRKYLGLKEDPPDSNCIIFNQRFYGKDVRVPWCVTFQWNGFNELGAAELFCGGLKTASCGDVRRWAIAHNRWIDDPKDLGHGDLVIFDFEQDGNLDTDHIGFVVSNNGRQLITLEGNTGYKNNSNGGEVMERQRNYSVCIGGFRPDYASDTTEEAFDMYLTEIAKRTNKTTAEVVDALVALVGLANTNIDQFERDGVKYLTDNKLINSPHDPRESVSYGALGLIMKRSDEMS